MRKCNSDTNLATLASDDYAYLEGRSMNFVDRMRDENTDKNVYKKKQKYVVPKHRPKLKLCDDDGDEYEPTKTNHSLREEPHIPLERMPRSLKDMDAFDDSVGPEGRGIRFVDIIQQPDDLNVEFVVPISSSTKSEEEYYEWSLSEKTISPKNNHTEESFVDKIYAKPKTFGGALTQLINNLFENPEGRMTNVQRVTIVLFTAFEAYRTIISSFLIVFVPQNCGGYSCTIIQNLLPRDKLEIAAISVNTFMAFSFCILFTIENVRESLIKKYLIADKTSPTNKEYLVKMIAVMEKIHRRKILRINSVYRVFAQILLLTFFINAGISCIVIRKNFLNNTTVTVFITNTFFMIHRIHKALKITSSGKYNIYSAYRSSNLLYNRYRGTWLENERWNTV